MLHRHQGNGPIEHFQNYFQLYSQKTMTLVGCYLIIVFVYADTSCTYDSFTGLSAMPIKPPLAKLTFFVIFIKDITYERETSRSALWLFNKYQSTLS